MRALDIAREERDDAINERDHLRVECAILRSRLFEAIETLEGEPWANHLTA